MSNIGFVFFGFGFWVFGFSGFWILDLGLVCAFVWVVRVGCRIIVCFRLGGACGMSSIGFVLFGFGFSGFWI
jgi:hypothetical protein